VLATITIGITPLVIAASTTVLVRWSLIPVTVVAITVAAAVLIVAITIAATVAVVASAVEITTARTVLTVW